MVEKLSSKTEFVLVFDYSGKVSFRNTHFSKGFKTAEEAHNYVIARGKEIADAGTACRFVVSQNKQSNDGEDKVIYRGRVMKTFIEYTLYNIKEDKKVISRKSNKNFNKNSLISISMKANVYLSENETLFLGLDGKAVKKIAAKCVNAVNSNVDKGEDAVVKAVAKVSKRLVEVHLQNKVGKQKEGSVCLQLWDLYNKVHYKHFLDLPIGSQKYKCVNGTVKIENLEENIIEVHKLGQELLKKITASDTTEQSSSGKTAATEQSKLIASGAKEITLNAADESSQSAGALVDAKELVDTIARTIVAYHGISDSNLSLMGAQSVSYQVETNSHGLFSAAIDNEKITVNCINGRRDEITTDAPVDDIYNSLHNSVIKMLISLSIVDNARVASVVDVHSVESLYDIAA